ncbi:helix-turn-helix domain-containing protein [Paramaledivibacter caminithermalis]|jgi:transposase|uniref:Helix-turn-helix domain of transposase family ISL3 n=1 Tax=Paramaledivibacter caminithermalis (strain DSM 15212 / CIP 107654 / DViRD3) TaxID=1121301 RepID=A0A1M6QH37_PARC5|nr:helix-turn-helix domain-containing protein [Paramaledivibacter caminithermalis]SHK19526.1 Helix-turn-helix domain of transposase family ISL3 [Paramaledivibacter caminithermalis DSM 15212]
MTINYDFIRNLIGLQGIKVVYSNVNNGIFKVFATSVFNIAICLDCGRITYTVHDKKFQAYKRLLIWGMDIVIALEKKRYVCSCNPKHPFDESFSFIRKYGRYTTTYENYIFTLTHKNTVKNVSNIIGNSGATCQRIYNHYAKAKAYLAGCKPEPLRFLGIDDIAFK